MECVGRIFTQSRLDEGKAYPGPVNVYVSIKLSIPKGNIDWWRYYLKEIIVWCVFVSGKHNDVWSANILSGLSFKQL